MPETIAHDGRGSFLLYGASGFSGQLIARAAVGRGLRPILAGRDGAALERLAAELGLEYRTAAIADASALDRALAGVGVVLHCAGPFSSTALPMLDACLRNRTHYLDLTGEVEVIERLAARSESARRAGIMVMPGVGLDVVAGDCLVRHVARRLPRASRLALGVQGLRLISRGTARTVVEAAGTGFVRRGGSLVPQTMGSLVRSFDFGWGPVECRNVSWADLATAWYTTGIPDIDVYCEATLPLRLLSTGNSMLGGWMATPLWQIWLKAHVDLIPPGPGPDSRRMASAILVAEVESADGRRASARLKTPEAYTFTAMVAPVIVERTLRGDFEAGFQTPARVYGADFPLSLDGVVREDLQ